MLKRDNINNTVHDIITHLQDRFAIDVKTSDIVELFEDVKVYCIPTTIITITDNYNYRKIGK